MIRGYAASPAGEVESGHVMDFPPDTPDDALQAFREGYEAQMGGRLEEAVEHYRRSIAIHPTAEAHTFLGWALSFHGRPDEAIAECRTAIARRPRLRQPLQRHRRLPDRARPRGRGDHVARARKARGPLRAAPLPVLQPRPRLRQAAQGARGHPRAPAGHRHRAALYRRPSRAAPVARPAQLTRCPLPFYDNPILFGRSGSRGLIAFESAGDAVRVWSRGRGGSDRRPGALPAISPSVGSRTS